MFYDGKDSDSEWNGGQVICKSYGVTKQLVEIVYFQLHKPFSLFPCLSSWFDYSSLRYLSVW